MLRSLVEQREQLIGLDKNTLLKVLGQPDSGSADALEYKIPDFHGGFLLTVHFRNGLVHQVDFGEYHGISFWGA